MSAKKRYGLLCLLLGTCGVAGAEGFYAGARVGIMDVEVSDFDEATNAGILLGYEFPSGIPLRWGLEAEFTTTVADGDFRLGGVSGDWDIDTQALYVVARAGERLYGKVRAGALREDVSAGAGGISVDDSDSGISAGLGIGWRATASIDLEAEFTMIEDDVNFFSAGINIGF